MIDSAEPNMYDRIRAEAREQQERAAATPPLAERLTRDDRHSEEVQRRLRSAR